MISVLTLLPTHVPKLLLLLISACTKQDSASLEPIRISIIGTNDVHGALVLEKQRGGLVTLSGYIGSVRAAREEDGGDDVLTPAMPEGGFMFDGHGPLTRDVLVGWFRMQPGRMNAADFQSTDNPRWTLPDELAATCTLPTSTP